MDSSIVGSWPGPLTQKDTRHIHITDWILSQLFSYIFDSIYSKHYLLLLVVNQIMNIYSSFYYLCSLQYTGSPDDGGGSILLIYSSIYPTNHPDPSIHYNQPTSPRVTKEEKLIKLMISVDSVNC